MESRGGEGDYDETNRTGYLSFSRKLKGTKPLDETGLTFRSIDARLIQPVLPGFASAQVLTLQQDGECRSRSNKHVQS